jgi:hypothetical protein
MMMMDTDDAVARGVALDPISDAEQLQSRVAAMLASGVDVEAAMAKQYSEGCAAFTPTLPPETVAACIKKVYDVMRIAPSTSLWTVVDVVRTLKRFSECGSGGAFACVVPDERDARYQYRDAILADAVEVRLCRWCRAAVTLPCLLCGCARACS